MGSGLATLNLTTKPCFDSPLPTPITSRRLGGVCAYRADAIATPLLEGRKGYSPGAHKSNVIGDATDFPFRYPVAEYASIRKFLRMDSTIKPVTLISFAHM